MSLTHQATKKPRPGRMSICYAAPGHSLLSTSGSARNILSLVHILSRWADVTVAFRTIREPFHSDTFRVIAIEPEIEGAARRDDVAARGLNVFSHISYLRRLSLFSRESAHSYDLIFEKGWRLSGFLSSAFCRYGVPGVLVENDVRHWSESVGSVRNLARYGAHNAAQAVSKYYSRRIPLVIAETDELKAMLVANRGMTAEKVEVVGLGVDHELFRPLDQASCRKALGIHPQALVLLYVGGMDTYHDMGPVIDVLTRISVPSLELHLVGDGEYRGAYDAKARHAKVPVRFHGQVPHSRVPEFIGAADLCLAPYRVSAFPNESVSFSTLKIPEYMACGRPVASVPSGHIKKLIENQVSGLLFSNDVQSWVNFLKTLPPRERFKQMGDVALSAVESISWEQTARRYLEVCRGLIAEAKVKAEAKV